MNKQEIYNNVKKHLLEQNEKSRDGASCRYRDAVGRKCAIGALIPDELYDPRMEGKSVASLLLNYPGLCEVFGIEPLESRLDYDRPDVEFLSDLQGVHDSCSVDRWEEKLSVVAIGWELEP